MTVGKAGVAASKWAAGKTVDAAEWAARETAAAARWTESKIEQAAQAAKQAAIAGVRGTAKTIGRSVLYLGGETDSASRQIGLKVATALDKIKSVFGDSKPAEPLAPCSVNPSKDVDIDGTLISYPGGKCDWVTSKGQRVGSKEIANAEAKGYESKSACCKAKRRNGMSPRTIAYVNGVMTDKKKHCDTLKAIGDCTCAKVFGVYNATEDFYRDAVQTSQDRKAIAAANEGHPPRTGDGRNPAVDTLTRVVQSKHMNGEPLELWAHSQGGAVSSLALYDATNALQIHGISDSLRGVRVKSFGAAAPNWPDGPEYEHYVHVNDFTPVTFGLGEDAVDAESRAGQGATTTFFSGDPDGGPFATDYLQRSAIPAPKGNHDVIETYLKMERQQHGGC